MIKEVFKHIRGAEMKQQDPEVLDVLALYQKEITNPTPLTQRDIPVVSLSPDQRCTKAPASGPHELDAHHREARAGFIAQSVSASVERGGTCSQDSCLGPAIHYGSDVIVPGISGGPVATRGGHLADHRGIATRSHHPHHEECRLSGVVVGEVRHADVASHSGVGSTYR